MVLPSPYQVEQLIKKQVTITAGSTTKTAIDIPQGNKVALKGYGYTWYTSNTYKLGTGNMAFPARTDQEGAPSIPRIFEVAFPCRSGGQAYLEITNGDSSDHTYDIAFYFYCETFLEVTSTGGELVIATGAGTTGAAVAIYNSSITTAANVTARGLAVDPYMPTAIVSGQASHTGSAAAMPAGTLLDGVMLQADPTNTDYVYLGNSAGQKLALGPGQSTPKLKVASLASIYVLVGSGTQKVNYWGT